MSKIETKKPYELICGLEVHAELKTISKMFCGCKNDPFHAPAPNVYTCPVCLGMPGGSPVANRAAIEWTIKVGLALNCKVNLFSKFDRKHYFYPDLAKGYQISQYDIPFCHGGYLDTSFGRVRIRRIHLEEDTGKLLHTTLKSEKVSLVDFNRSGVPLIEIVTEPDINNAAQAKEYGKKLRQLLRYLDVADCDMQEGGMRLEANVSVRPAGAKELPNYKVEVKNINSFRFLEQAIEYEIDRQSYLVDNGETPPQETRGWSVEKNETFTQRSKEEAEDYRYFPDPDLPPVRLTEESLHRISKEIPELFDAKIERWEKEYGVEQRNGHILAEEKATADWYENLFTTASREELKPNDLAKAIVNKKFAVTVGEEIKKSLERFKETKATTSVDESALLAAIETLFAQNPDAVQRYKAGETKVMGFFMGQVMKTLGGKVDAGQVKSAIEEMLIKE